MDGWGLTIRVVVSATAQTSLYPQAILVAEELGPDLIQFPVEVEIAPFEGGVSDESERYEGRPEEEIVEGEDRTRGKERSGEADEGREDAEK